MAVYRVKGLKRGKWYVRSDGSRVRYLYYRAGKDLIRLHEKEGSPEFLLEIEGIKRRISEGEKPITEPQGSWGWLVKKYQDSPEYQELSEKTKVGYQRYIGVLSALSKVPLLRFSRKEVIAIRDKFYTKAKEKSGSGIRSAEYLVSVIGLIWEWGRQRSLVPAGDNPAHGVPKLKKQKKDRVSSREKAWSDAEVERALALSSGGIRLAIALAVYTGQRQGDILSFTWDDIREGWLTVKQSKTGQSLFVPLHPDLVTLLQAAEDFKGSIVKNSHGKPYTPDGFQTVYGRFASKLKQDGLLRKDRTFHGLRHTAATRLADAGADDRTIMAITGHKQTSMVSVYTAGADQKKRAEDGMNRLLKSQKGAKLLEKTAD